MSRTIRLCLLMVVILSLPVELSAQQKTKKQSKKEQAAEQTPQNLPYRVVGGMRELLNTTSDTLASQSPSIDSLANGQSFLDSLALAGIVTDSLALPPTEEAMASALRDSLMAHGVDAATADSIVLASLSNNAEPLTARERRRLERESRFLDSMATRQSKIFRDSIPISRLTAISAVVPGFAQLYSGHYWKIPLNYVAIGVPAYMGIKQNSKYKDYKSQYDELIKYDAARSEIDPIQTEMIRHNTYRQLWFAGAAAAYMGFLANGIITHPGALTSIKKATTLSMILPGAGQFYNKSYWKIPIVLGGFASMAYIVDWNNRGYQRFKLAEELLSDGDDQTVDEFDGRYDSTFLLNLKSQYRRNRDLAIIGLVGVYLINVIDAHVDANLKDYDVSDDLSFNIEPHMDNIRTSVGINNTIGFNISFGF